MTNEPHIHRTDGAATPAGALAQLASGTGRLVLKDFLTHIAQLAVVALAPADGVGLTLSEAGEPDVIVGTSDLVRAVDVIQYGRKQGPSISAATSGQTKRSGSLGTEKAWPGFGRRAARLGVHSVLSVPVTADDLVLGSLNLYSGRRDAFDDDAVALAQAFAAPVAVSIRNAKALYKTQGLAIHLLAQVSTRAVIDQAVGIILSRSGCSPDRALDQLRAAAQAQDRPLRNVAQHTVDETIERAGVARREASYAS